MITTVYKLRKKSTQEWATASKVRNAWTRRAGKTWNYLSYVVQHVIDNINHKSHHGLSEFPETYDLNDLEIVECQIETGHHYDLTDLTTFGADGFLEKL